MKLEEQIKCIVTNGPKTDCTCIIQVRTFSNQKFTVTDVITLMDSGYRFYLIDPKDDSRVNVIKAQRDGKWYIRTKPNDTPDDNLLKLPDCY